MTPAWRIWAGLALLATALLAVAVPANAQAGLYAGGSIGAMTYAQSRAPEQPGGTTWSGSVTVGVQVSRTLGVEFEHSFGGEVSADKYSYRPSPSLHAEVVSKGRDRIFIAQVRWRIGPLEPVGGAGFVRSTGTRHASFIPGGRTYFHDEWSQEAFVVAAGLDAAIGAGRNFQVVPTFRMFLVARPGGGSGTGRASGGPIVFRYGAGARVTF